MDIIILTARSYTGAVDIDDNIRIYRFSSAGIIAVISAGIHKFVELIVYILNDIVAEYHSVRKPCSVIDRTGITRLIADIVNIIILKQRVAAEIAERKMRSVIDLVMRYDNTVTAVTTGCYLTEPDSSIVGAAERCVIVNEIVVNERIGMLHINGIRHPACNTAATDIAYLIIVYRCVRTDKVDGVIGAVTNDAVADGIVIARDADKTINSALDVESVKGVVADIGIYDAAAAECEADVDILIVIGSIEAEHARRVVDVILADRIDLFKNVVVEESAVLVHTPAAVDGDGDTVGLCIIALDIARGGLVVYLKGTVQASLGYRGFRPLGNSARRVNKACARYGIAEDDVRVIDNAVVRVSARPAAYAVVVEAAVDAGIAVRISVDIRPINARSLEVICNDLFLRRLVETSLYLVAWHGILCRVERVAARNDDLLAVVCLIGNGAGLGAAVLCGEGKRLKLCVHALAEIYGYSALGIAVPPQLSDRVTSALESTQGGTESSCCGVVSARTDIEHDADRPVVRRYRKSSKA